jgi:ABC-2 type transport system ATP-binding protein
MSKTRIEVKNITSGYKKFKIKDITFSLKEGDRLGLIGSSGSGKSTLLETLVGLKKADTGEITITSADKKKVSLKEVLSYSPQRNSLFPLLTLEENLYTFGKLHKMKSEEIEVQIKQLLPRFGLQGAEKKRIIHLSGGMRKRADLAVTLLPDPKVIVLDEPFAGLDISLIQFIWKLLVSLSKEGKIFIISSHRITDIQKYCNEFGLIHHSKYYNTQQIKKQMKTRGEKSIPSYIEKLFSGKTKISQRLRDKDDPILDLGATQGEGRKLQS